MPENSALAQLIQVTDDEETILGSRQGDAHAVVYLQETHLALIITSDQGQQDDVVLLALKVVHDGDANVFAGVAELALFLKSEIFDVDNVN